MQQGGSITFERVAQYPALETWHVVVAAILFACVIYGANWRLRKSESDAGSLRLSSNRLAAKEREPEKDRDAWNS
jgi:hypothetical protein